MIPVTQTKMVVRNSNGDIIVRGNCLAACVASILELPITEVPNVETLFNVSDTYYYDVLYSWLKSLGYEYGTDDRFKVFHKNKYFNEENREALKAYCKNKYYLVSGKSSRGVTHLCIYKNGKLVHDPHPTKEGLLTEDFFESIEKL